MTILDGQLLLLRQLIASVLTDATLSASSLVQLQQAQEILDHVGNE